MTTYVEISEALVTAGYLSEADVEAAAAILADALIVQAAEEAEAEAMDDYDAQEDLIAEAEVWEAEDEDVGDFASAEVDEDIISDAAIQEERDEDAVLAAEDLIDEACADAGAALLAAELIDEADLTPVVAVIHEYNCG